MNDHRYEREDNVHKHLHLLQLVLEEYYFFILLYVPCLAAMGVVAREIGLGLAVLMATVQTILAWAIAVLLYQVPVGGNMTWIVAAIVVLVGTGIFLKLFGMKANKEKRFED